ncbi:MAG: hypothetical protein K2N48_05575 [Muribaculaceae bacterium]|nr:hypothetical protein [Muribaculaceae bacterium]
MNLKTFVAAAALATLSLPISIRAYADTSSVPETVTAVYPQPDSRVDLGSNAYPLGLQRISFMFKNDVTVNPNCQGEACIYLEDNNVPLQTVGVSGASIDHMQSNMGAVTFPHACTANGKYKITIPEGFWLTSGTQSPYIGAMELYYEILVPQRIWPSEQVSKELKEFRLEFPGYDEARLLSPDKIEFFRFASPDIYPVMVTVGKNEDGTNANYIRIVLEEPVTEQGEYGLFVQAGAAEGIRYSGGDGDKKETADPNIEIIYPYTVSRIDAPSISPAEGPVETFVPFELSIPENPEFWFVNDKAVSFIYPVGSDGNISPDAVYRLTGVRDDDTDKIILTIVENGEKITSVTPQPGSYALKLASGLFSGSWNGEFINSAPFIYYYNVIGTPDGVKIVSATDLEGIRRGVYTIDGRKVKDASESIRLPEGVYVIDGQKKYIKN